MASSDGSVVIDIKGDPSNFESSVTKTVKTIDAEFKTLKTSLSVIENSFNGNANSMVALSEKGSILAAMYGKQQEKISLLENELKKAQSAQQEYTKRISEAKENISLYESKLNELKSSEEDTSQEQKELSKSIKEWNIELKNAQKGQESATIEIEKYKQQINLAGLELDKIDNELQKNNKYLDEASTSADGCATSIDEFGKSVNQTEKETNNFDDELDNAAESAENFGKTSESAIDSLAQVMVAAGIADKVADIASALYSCVETFSAFESQMSTVKAISGATASEMEQLSQKAKEMGASSAFTATEAAQAYEYMAMAGWNSTEMLDGLEGIMNLAAASGEDLAQVSDIVTDGLTAFGLSAKDSSHFADVLAEASARSNTNVSMMGESFKYVAPVAGSMGVSIEDTAVALGLMANAGVKGSMSGTALRSMLTRLAKPTKQVTQYTDALGISLTNSSGNIKSLSTVMGDLREAFGGLTEAQKAEYAAGIAGQEAMSGLLAIVNASDADFDALTVSIQNCNGAAQQMAETKLDNFEGQVVLLDSALDGLKMTIGSQLAPVLQLMAEGATTAVGGLNLLLERCPALSAILAGLVASAGAFVAALTGFQILRTITPLLKAFNVALAANPAGAVAIAVVGVVTALGTLAASCADARNGVSGLNKQMQEIDKTYQESETKTIATANAASALIDKLSALESQQSMTEGETALYAQTVDQLRTMLPELNIALDEQTGLLVNGTAALQAQVEAWKENAIAQAMQEKYASLLQGQADSLIVVAETQLSYNDALATCTDLERQMADVSAELQKVESDSALTYDEKSTLVNELLQKMADLSNQYVLAKDNLSAQSSEMEKAKTAASEFDAEVENLNRLQVFMQDGFESSGSAMQDFQGYADGVVEKMSSLETAYTETAEKALESIEGQFKAWDDLSGKVEESEIDIEKALESQQKYWNDLSDNITELSNRSVDGIDELVIALNDGSVEGAAAIESLTNKSDEDLQRLVDQYNATKDAQSRWAGESANIITGYSDQMSALADQMMSDVQEMDLNGDALQAGKNTIQGYIDGVNQNKGSLSTAMRNAANNAWASFKNAIGIHSPSKAFRESGQDSIEGYVLGVDDESDSLQKEMEETAKSAYSSFTNQMISGIDKAMPSLNTKVKRYMLGLVDSANSATKSLADNTADIFTKATADKFKELEKVYEEATENAKKSAQKQFDLFDDLAEKSKKSTSKAKESSSDLIQSFQAQEQYWNKLAYNIDNLTSRNIDGLDKLVEAMNDGSEKGSEAIAYLAAKSDEELGDIVSRYNDLEAAQERWAISSTEAKKSTDELYAALEKLGVSQNTLSAATKEGSVNQELYNIYAEAAVEKLNELDKAYQDAAASALSSAQKQFELWDDLSQKSEESTVDLVQSLKAQEEYWNALSDNVENLTTRNIKGLTDMVNAMNDGSQKGAQYIAQLAGKSDPELKKLVQQYEQTKNAQESWANASANALTSYQSKVDETIDAFQQSVQKMNMADQANQAGQMTMQGFINGLNSQASSVNSTISTIASAAWGVFQNVLRMHSPSKLFEQGGKWTMEGYGIGVDEESKNVNKIMEEAAETAATAFNDNNNVNVPDISKLAITDDLQALVMKANEAVAAEVGSFSGKVSLVADARRSAASEPQTVTNDNGIVVNLNYYGTGEPTDIKRISRQIGIEAAKEMRSRGVLA